jgi:hypothetical protein
LTQLLPPRTIDRDAPVIYNPRHHERMAAPSAARAMRYLHVFREEFWMKGFATIQGPQRRSRDSRFAISPGIRAGNAYPSGKQETESKSKTNRFVHAPMSMISIQDALFFLEGYKDA